jgi:hypothetical protein
MLYLILFIFSSVIIALASTSYFSSREFYDFITVLYNFLYWLIVIFMSNTVFTSIFVIEVLSTLIFLLVITSTFSSNFFLRNLNLSFGHLFQQSTPHTYLISLLYFFSQPTFSFYVFTLSTRLQNLCKNSNVMYLHNLAHINCRTWPPRISQILWEWKKWDVLTSIQRIHWFWYPRVADVLFI